MTLLKRLLFVALLLTIAIPVVAREPRKDIESKKPEKSIDEQIREIKAKKVLTVDDYVKLSNLTVGNEKSVLYAKKAIELDNANSMAHNNYGAYLTRKGEIYAAEKELMLAIKFNNKNAIAYINLGFLKAKQKDYMKSIELYRRSIEINDCDPDAYFNMGISYHYIKKHGKAIKAYLKAIELDPSYIKAQQELGVSYFYVGQQKKAIDQFRLILKFNPSHKEAKQSLEYILKKHPELK